MNRRQKEVFQFDKYISFSILFFLYIHAELDRLAPYRSDHQELERGVPQGSVLDPLFLSYVADIFKVVISGVSVLYADDMSTVLFADGFDLRYLALECVGQASHYCSKNNLLLNLKTIEMIHGNTKETDRSPYVKRVYQSFVI